MIVTDVISITASASSFCYSRDIGRINSWCVDHGLFKRADENLASMDTDDIAYPKQATHRVSCFADMGFRRFRGKTITMRSWRNPTAIGGSCSRKAARRELNRRTPIKMLILVSFDDVPQQPAVG